MSHMYLPSLTRTMPRYWLTKSPQYLLQEGNCPLAFFLGIPCETQINSNTLFCRTHICLKCYIFILNLTYCLPWDITKMQVVRKWRDFKKNLDIACVIIIISHNCWYPNAGCHYLLKNKFTLWLKKHNMLSSFYFSALVGSRF